MATAWRHGTNKRGTAGFALVAVALLVVGGAAALYLHRVDEAASAAADAARKEGAQLEAEAHREIRAIRDVAVRALAEAVGGRFDPAGRSLASLRAPVEANLTAALAREYPRTTSSGHEVRADLLFVVVVPVEAAAGLASPFGGVGRMEVPAYIGVQGVVNLSVNATYASFSSLLGFSGHLGVPALLPISIAERFAAEASPGGRVERLIGQFAQRAMALDSSCIANESWPFQMVKLALAAERYLQFGASANATVHARMTELLRPSGEFIAADLVGEGTSTSEALHASATGAFAVDGEPSPVTVEILDFTIGRFDVGAPRTYFDGAELGGGTWAALRIQDSFSLSISARVSSGAGSLEVGPISVPVAFNARAFAQRVPDEAIVPAAALSAALAEMTTAWHGGTWYDSLIAIGEKLNNTGYFQLNDNVRALALSILGERHRAALPPVESDTAFARANAPEVAGYREGTVQIAFPQHVGASHAQVVVDGLPIGFHAITGGAVRIARLPEGVHSLQIEVTSGGTVLAGAAEVVVLRGTWDATVAVAARYDGAFLQAALERAQAQPGRAGLVLLAEAGAIAGMEPPGSPSVFSEITAYAEAAQARLAALDLSKLASKAAAARVRDARAMVRILLPIVEAAGTAYADLTESKAPVGGFVGSVATLVITGDPKALLSASINTIEVARVQTRTDDLAFHFRTRGGAWASRTLPLEQILLAANTLANALTLVADLVKIEEAFGTNSTATDVERSAVLAGTGLHLAKITLGVAQSVYKIVAPALAQVLKDSFKIVGIGLAAATVILDLVMLYDETRGDATAIYNLLFQPTNVADLARLPSLVGGAVSVIAGIYFVTAGVGAKGGPVGAAAALFVLAGLLVANKETVASAIFGTLTYGSLDGIRQELSNSTSVAFSAASVANTVDVARATQSRRSLSVRASGAVGDHRADASAPGWRARAFAVGAFMDEASRLACASRALVEQADDFASPPYDKDPGRYTEGYRALHTLAGNYNYSGDVSVNVSLGPGLNGTLGRADWRALLGTINNETLAKYSFHYRLTQTNGIPESQFSLWATKLAAAGTHFTLAVAEFQIAANALKAS